MVWQWALIPKAGQSVLEQLVFSMQMAWHAQRVSIPGEAQTQMAVLAPARELQARPMCTGFETLCEDYA